MLSPQGCYAVAARCWDDLPRSGDGSHWRLGANRQSQRRRLGHAHQSPLTQKGYSAIMPRCGLAVDGPRTCRGWAPPPGSEPADSVRTRMTGRAAVRRGPPSACHSPRLPGPRPLPAAAAPSRRSGWLGGCRPAAGGMRRRADGPWPAWQTAVSGSPGGKGRPADGLGRAGTLTFRP